MMKQCNHLYRSYLCNETETHIANECQCLVTADFVHSTNNNLEKLVTVATIKLIGPKLLAVMSVSTGGCLAATHHDFLRGNYCDIQNNCLKKKKKKRQNRLLQLVNFSTGVKIKWLEPLPHRDRQPRTQPHLWCLESSVNLT